MEIARTIEVNCRPEHLWTYLEDPTKMTRWMKGLVAFERLNDGPPRPGSVARLTIKEGARFSEYHSKVVARTPPKHLVIVMTGKSLGAGEMHVDYRLTELGNRTRLDYLCTCELRGFFMKLMGKLAAGLARKQLDGFLSALKHLAETEPMAA